MKKNWLLIPDNCKKVVSLHHHFNLVYCMSVAVNVSSTDVKHIFIVNPYAGKKDATEDIKAVLRPYCGKIDYEIYVTKGPKDATVYCREYCLSHPDRVVRFYACGGDGTINEVVTGIAGMPNAQMSCYPCGSGNDYIKYYGKQADFLEVENTINGVARKVDLMQVDVLGCGKNETRYSLNVCNFGFDSEVCRTMIEVKRKPLIGGKNAYTTGIVKAIFTGRSNQVDLDVDGEVFHRGKMLLCTLSNGQYVGGAYKCAPRSKNDDGLVEICMAKPMMLARFVSMIGAYKRGEHLDDPKFQNLLKYRRGREITMTSGRPFWVTIDGDMLCSDKYKVTQLPGAITFVAPGK